MEYVYVIYDSANTAVVGIFNSVPLAREAIKSAAMDSDEVFIKRVPLNKLHDIDDSSDDLLDRSLLEIKSITKRREK